MSNQTDVTRRSIFACLASGLDQLPLSTNPVSITFDIENAINGLDHSTSVSPEEIVIRIPGTYTVTAQGQVGKNSGGIKDDHDTFLQWDRQDGAGFVDVPNSNIITTIKDSEITFVGVVSLTDVLLATWKIRIMQRLSNAAVGLGLHTTPAVGGPPTTPLTPSMILTVVFNAAAGAPV